MFHLAAALALELPGDVVPLLLAQAELGVEEPIRKAVDLLIFRVDGGHFFVAELLELHREPLAFRAHGGLDRRGGQGMSHLVQRLQPDGRCCAAVPAPPPGGRRREKCPSRWNFA